MKGEGGADGERMGGSYSDRQRGRYRKETALEAGTGGRDQETRKDTSSSLSPPPYPIVPRAPSFQVEIVPSYQRQTVSGSGKTTTHPHPHPHQASTRGVSAKHPG
jgi:hypothetical protein